MWVITHWSITKAHLAAAPFQFLDQQHLMDIFARQSIGRGDQDGIEGRLGCSIAEAIEPRAIQTGATKAVISLDMLVREGPALLLSQAGQARELLFDRLGLGLASCRDPRIDCDTHELPPAGWCYSTGWPPGAGVDRPDPSAAAHRSVAPSGGTPSIHVS